MLGCSNVQALRHACEDAHLAGDSQLERLWGAQLQTLDEHKFVLADSCMQVGVGPSCCCCMPRPSTAYSSKLRVLQAYMRLKQELAGLHRQMKDFWDRAHTPGGPSDDRPAAQAVAG